MNKSSQLYGITYDAMYNLSIFYYFVTAPYAVPGISPVKVFFDNGLALSAPKSPSEALPVQDTSQLPLGSAVAYH